MQLISTDDNSLILFSYNYNSSQIKNSCVNSFLESQKVSLAKSRFSPLMHKQTHLIIATKKSFIEKIFSDFVSFNFAEALL
jgi:hypothetical protein